MNLIEVIGSVECTNPSSGRKSIVLWGPQSLFIDSIEIFLKAEAGWDVVKFYREWDVDLFIQQVNFLKPKVIVICQEKDESDEQVLLKLSRIPACLKVVILNMENNIAQVYGRHHVVLRDVSHLLSVVDHEFFSNKLPDEEVPGNNINPDQIQQHLLMKNQP